MNSDFPSVAQSVLFQAMPPPPREPSPRARKLIFRYQGTQFVKLLVGAIFSVVGVPFVLAFGWGVPSDVLVSVGGAQGRGQVVALHEDLSSEINGVHPVVVRFDYEVGGRRYTDESSTVDRELTGPLQVGDAVPIEYARRVPEWARVRGTTRSFFGYFGLLTVLFPLVGLGLALGAWRENRREIKAYVWGRPAAARKLSFGEDYSARVNNRHPWKLTWELDVDGRRYTGSLSSMNREDLAELASGEQVPVLYLDDDPKVNTAYVP